MTDLNRIIWFLKSSQTLAMLPIIIFSVLVFDPYVKEDFVLWNFCNWSFRDDKNLRIYKSLVDYLWKWENFKVLLMQVWNKKKSYVFEQVILLS